MKVLKPEPTLTELRAEMEAALEPGAKGMRCHVCRKWCHKDKRKLDSRMARCLIRLYVRWEADPESWVPWSRIQARGAAGDVAFMRHFGLTRESTVEAGLWQITKKGRRFVERACTVPRFAWRYNRKTFGLSDEQTTIDQALTDRFDLDQLLRSAREQ